MNQERLSSNGGKYGLAKHRLHHGMSFGEAMVIQQKILTICGTHGKGLAQL